MLQRTVDPPAHRFELDRIFPIVDITSALLMKIKARYVFSAGAITATEFAEINRRADKVIGGASVAAQG